MVESQINVIQRIAYLVGDGRAEAADDGAFSACCSWASRSRFFSSSAVISLKLCAEPADFVTPGLRHADSQVAVGDLPCGIRKICDRPRKSPNEQKCDQRRNQQNAERINERLSGPPGGLALVVFEQDHHVPAALARLDRDGVSLVVFVYAECPNCLENA